MTTVFIVIAACLIDRFLGETKHYHPLVGFGHLAKYCEKRFNRTGFSVQRARVQGLCCWAILVFVPALTLFSTLTWLNETLQTLAAIIILYLTIGHRSLQEHADQVQADLQAGDLSAARMHVSWMVSRDTAGLDESDISKACMESVLENGNDALFAPIFWFCVLGPAGAVLYRLANTLDAMWGYRTPRFLNFGRAAAKLDDVLNYVPARLTALAYALAGNTANAFQCGKIQAVHWDSPNAGPVMAAGAGALNIKLGGVANYRGSIEARPILGSGAKPQLIDIHRSQQLLNKACFLWIGTLCFMALLTLIA